jgi:16S rRNA processing protein RimM
VEPSVASWIAVVHLLRPQGRRGELLAELLTDQTELLTPGREFWLAKPGVSAPSNASSRTLEEAWEPTGRNAGRWVLKLSGSESINDAEALAGQELMIPASEIPALEEDTYFVRDLVGCELYDGDVRVGMVVGIEYLIGSGGRRVADAAPLLAVELAQTEPSPPHAQGEETIINSGNETSSEPELIPFLRLWLDSVDLAQRRIIMHLPAGLLDTEQ